VAQVALRIRDAKTSNFKQLRTSNLELQTMTEAFESAVARSKEFTKRPSNEELLQLYALYKQATEGDVSGERPGGFDFKAIAKFDAWEELKGKSTEQAEREYIQLVDTLQQQYR
jgi:diazepam-binding inhibitor (GABA receptor modulator, acyl-CoA-binding protein)